MNSYVLSYNSSSSDPILSIKFNLSVRGLYPETFYHLFELKLGVLVTLLPNLPVLIDYGENDSSLTSSSPWFKIFGLG
jgi:hypothetical protein